MQEGDLLTYSGKPLKLFGLDYTELVYVEAGSFMMGDNDKEVHFNKGYYIGKYLVTQELFKEVKGKEPSIFKGKHRPVENVSYNEICIGSGSFLSKLNLRIKEVYPDLKGEFALPSETQWEYAARGGKFWVDNKMKYAGGQNINDVAWYSENSNNETMRTGLQVPNFLEIYDMSGNVWEWCEDWYIFDLIKIPSDGRPYNEKTSFKVIRGGSFNDSSKICRLSFRYNCRESERYSDLGLRLVYSE